MAECTGKSQTKSETSPKSPEIAILLSTYNGEMYVEELLNSLRDQKYQNWDLWIRDDGSGDNTVAIIKQFQTKLAALGRKNSVYLTEGENIGVTGSFFTLAEAAERNYDAFAFCDQDDIWHPDKLERAASALQAYQADSSGSSSSDDEKPFLYHCRQWMVSDEQPSVRKMSPIPKRTGFENALVQNQVVGCTMVINPALRHMMLKAFRRYGIDVSAHVIMHDWWCYLLTSAFGVIHYDPHPSISFRRHHHSSSPAATGFLTALEQRAAKMQTRSWSVIHILNQANCFRQLHGECNLSKMQHRLLHDIVRLKKAGLSFRLKYFIFGRHHRSTRMETLIFRFLVVMAR